MKKAVLLVATLMVSGAALAASTVIIGSYKYTCQNTCVVGKNAAGETAVSDSRGGWVTQKPRFGGGVPAEMK